MYSSQLVWCLYIILCFSEYKVLLMKLALFLGLYSSQIIECDSTIKSLLSFIDFNRRALSNSRKTKRAVTFSSHFRSSFVLKSEARVLVILGRPVSLPTLTPKECSCLRESTISKITFFMPSCVIMNNEIEAESKFNKV